jgi:hypothetical protein
MWLPQMESQELINQSHNPAKVQKVPVHTCKGNLTILRRILYLDLAKGNPK